MTEVQRILKSRTHYHVLGFDSVHYVELSAVRRYLKNHPHRLKYLVQAHIVQGSTKPSRVKYTQTSVHTKVLMRAHILAVFTCILLDAEDAFKRLSVAYECLSDETLQHEYLAKTSGSKKRPRPPQARPPTTKPETTTTTKQRPRKPRTAADIYADFLKEEERQAELDFLKRGFERTFDDTRATRPPSPPPVHSDDFVADILSSGLESKQAKWARFANPTSSHLSNILPVPTAGPQKEVPMCCLLCRRKFPSLAQLARHQAESKLHAANMAKQKE
ncbi:hypothetical protein DYB28_003278 [Aphanomyces astaci]|uniref:Uncharacterized protein n=1 Tax=Aphanomyces astaci TaxID=112090 RepID=A0A397DHL9_APHAT|nr:hypothetical protein DYB36_003323 [Aphanomyces astaci]RHY18340.1 hypothetical protein DYB25_007354 [Aphanomyces astaci]RHY48155.1 hypothetical protein DYB34_007447 [Aphanomyces astaci]RHY62255.1 hypothetical protein DYB30_001721 [Aphanomyces astaci]RLO08412.1 hypothetical protein DYB28_003278 [Aphanomyces astaci]